MKRARASSGRFRTEREVTAWERDSWKFPYIARITSVDAVVAKMLGTIKLAWERGQEWFDQLQVMGA